MNHEQSGQKVKKLRVVQATGFQYREIIINLQSPEGPT
jgi:hypothetical protein